MIFFQLKLLSIHKSLEFIFEDVRSRKPDYKQSVTKVFRFYSKDVWQRLYIICEAYLSQDDVNHVTGEL